MYVSIDFKIVFCKTKIMKTPDSIYESVVELANPSSPSVKFTEFVVAR